MVWVKTSEIGRKCHVLLNAVYLVIQTLWDIQPKKATKKGVFETNYSFIKSFWIGCTFTWHLPSLFPHFKERLTRALTVEQHVVGDIITSGAPKTHEKKVCPALCDKCGSWVLNNVREGDQGSILCRSELPQVFLAVWTSVSARTTTSVRPATCCCPLSVCLKHHCSGVNAVLMFCFSHNFFFKFKTSNNSILCRSWCEY